MLAAATALVLFLAANTAYNGFPLLGSILAQDRYLPRQLHTRGDRLAFSNGIVLLAGAAALLVWIYGADSTRLIQLYIVGVFVSFTLSQTGMVRHWNRHLRTETGPGQAPPHASAPARSTPSAPSSPAWCWSSSSLTKFTHGAWVALLGMVHLLRDDDRDPPPLRPGRRGDRRPEEPARRQRAPLPGALHRPGLQDPQARRCAPWPTPS